MNQLLRAPSSVGRRNSIRVDEERKGWSILRKKTNALNRSREERGRRAWLATPDLELRLGRWKETEKKRAKTMKRDEQQQ